MPHHNIGAVTTALTTTAPTSRLLLAKISVFLIYLIFFVPNPMLIPSDEKNLTVRVMLNHRITSENNDSSMSVTLHVNMEDYFTACRHLYDAEETLRQDYQQHHLDSSDRHARENYQQLQNGFVIKKLDPQLQSQFKEAYDEITAKITEHSFDGYELIIKQELSKLCDATNPLEQSFAKNLHEVGSNAPMIQLFDNHFKELLKNTMDTMILRSIKGESTETMLKMQISISRPINEESIHLDISDYAGGFQEAYISSFNNVIDAEKKKRSDTSTERHRSEKAHGNPYRKYCFGGEGAGMLAFARETVAISEHSFMTIGNVLHHDGSIGAKISLYAPLVQPTKSYIDRKYRSSDSSIGSSATPPLSTTSFKTSSPKSPLVATPTFFKPMPSDTTKTTQQPTGQHESRKKKSKPTLTLNLKPREGPK